MMVRIFNGLVATLSLLVFGQCTDPTPTPVPPVANTAPAVRATDPNVKQPPRIIPPVPVTTSTVVVAVGVPPVDVVPAPAWSSWSKWRITPAGVPFYSGHPACTVEQARTIATEFAVRGASVSTRQWAVYVASREGGCDHLAVNIGRTDDSHCTFQLNARPGGPLSPAGYLGLRGWTPTTVKASLADCARAAAELWARCGKGPWIQGDYSCRRPQS